MQDLEIYIRDLKANSLSEWLKAHLEELSLADEVVSGKAVVGAGRYHGEQVKISVYPGAFGKRFTCLILEGAHLPWSTDLDAARSAWRAMETEIRCSPGDWKEGDPVEEDKWWRLDERGEQRVVWN
ncbi:hypothetical protein [Marinobacter changyiensis]|uniref:hypothetical protein n=1 Tax=Marinobacter changyiensis TaxID=2604091 RepID=UPI0012649B61|nr:hypothetical protein [Marinobacter changyiensis]